MRLETNESARSRDRRAISVGRHIQRDRRGRLRLYVSGFRYRCPRCSWKAHVMKARIGAEHQADRHQRECAGSVRSRLAA